MNATQKDFLLRLFDIASAVMAEDYEKAEKLAYGVAADLNDRIYLTEIHDCQQCNCEEEL